MPPKLTVCPHHRSAALCQVYDSIFLDVPMSRVKFNVNSEYAYIQNFKVLQSRFRQSNTRVLTRPASSPHI